MKKATTLTELVIAVSLMAIVIFGAVSFDVASRSIMGTSERKVSIVNDFSLVADYFHKDASKATAYSGTNSCFYITNPSSGVVNVAMQQDVSNPASSADDVYVTYSFNYPAKTIYRNGEAMTNHYANEVALAQFVSDNSSINIVDLGLRFDVANVANASTNPEARGNVTGYCFGSSG